MYNPRDIIDLIATNVRKTGNPFGIPSVPAQHLVAKAPAASPGGQGDALLFTGLMYQAIPYIEATTRYLERLEGTRWADYLRFGRFSRYVPGFLVGRAFALLTSRAEKQRFNGILHSICRLLTKSGVDFFYHPEMDFYSGILLYDLGDQEGFVEHARFVARTLKLHRRRKNYHRRPPHHLCLKRALSEIYRERASRCSRISPCSSPAGQRRQTAGRRWPSTTPVFTAGT